jgi:Zn-dependent protease with chaperone function
MPVDIDLDFQRYVERKKGALEAQVREGGAYAYGADVRFKKTLDAVRPVRVAIEATARLWRGAAREELLAGTSKVTPESNARLWKIVDDVGKALHVPAPTLHVSSSFAGAHVFGADGDHAIVLEQALADGLSDEELRFVLGRELGHVQNDQVVLTTAEYYLTHAGSRFVQWVVTPAAAALSAWSRRADITSDRAGLIAARSLDAADSALRRLIEEPTVAEKRVAALRIFADSAYYKALVGPNDGQAGGLTQAEVDGKVGEVLT